MVIVDTSVWSLALRRKQAAADATIAALARLSLPPFAIDRDFGRYARSLGVRLHAVAM